VKTAAIVAWSGNGDFVDLQRSVSSKLLPDGGSITTGSKSLTVSKSDPVTVARRLAYLPGISWIAVGYDFATPAGCMADLAVLAKKYLRAGSSFGLTAQVEDSSQEEGDILLDGNGALLKSVKGTRIDERKPDVTFRVVMVRDKGAAGVELRRGPGGVPTSKSMKAFCLVSGGYHSAVVAWMSALSGFSLTLVHARADDESLRQVARLYSELSRRLDPSSIGLHVLDGGGSPGDRLASWLDATKGDVMAGIHPECRGRRSRAVLKDYPAVLMPLLLLQEDEVRAKLQSLGIKVKGVDKAPTLTMSGKTPFVVRHFAGKESDINGVLDGLLR